MAVGWKSFSGWALGVKRGGSGALYVAIFLLLSFATARAADVSSLIKQLDRTEWEIVSEEVTKRLPNLIGGEAEQALFKKLMQSSQEMAGIAEALQSGDYQGLGSLSASILARDLEAMAARRFGEDSRLFQSIQLVKGHPKLAKKLTLAALNADAVRARMAVREALKEYAEKEVAALQAQGEKFWKDMIRSVVPGQSVFSKLGVDPVDLYLQGIRDWSDFTSRTRLRFNNGMLDCLALRYRKIRDQGGSHSDARLEIENFDTGTGIGSNFDCSAEMRKRSGQTGSRSLSQRFVDFFRSTGRSTAALGELGMTSGEVVDLIQTYENSGGRTRGEFSDWLQDRLLKNITARADGLMSSINDVQKKAAAKQVSEAERLMAAIEAEIAKLDRDKDENSGGDKDKSTTGRRGGEAQTSGRAGEDNRTAAGAPTEDDPEPKKDEPEPKKETAQCDALTALVGSVDRRSTQASPVEVDKLVADLTARVDAARAEDNCPAGIFASADVARTRLEAMSGLRERFQQAIRSCDFGALQSLRSEAQRVAPGAFDHEVTLLQTAKTGIDQFKQGKASFDAGNYASAKATLQRALSAFGELPAGTCQTHAGRAQDGLDTTVKILAQEVIVNRAINTCDVPGMKKILNTYKNRKLRFFKVSVARITAALPDCEEKDRIIAEGKFCEAARGKLNSARADFQANRLKAARKTLVALNQKISNDNTKRCSDLPARVQQGLDNLNILRAEYDRLTAAKNNCDVKKLNKLLTRYRKKDHAWYKNATAYATRAIDTCNSKRPPTRQEAIADCRRQATAQDKVYGTTRFNQTNGSYTCHFCAKGFVSTGSACIPDVASAETDCRRQVTAQGKVYAKTQMHNDGSYNCHWCEPGHSYVNGSCWSATALADAQCRRDIARKGRTFARVEFLPNGRYVCHSCPKGQIYATDGRCWTQAAFVDARCRHDVARMGKVFARAVIQRNGQYRCLWCERGMYYRNGQCHSRQRDISRGVAAINGIIEQMQRGNTDTKGRKPTRRVNPGRVRKPGRKPKPGRAGRSRPPAKCIKNGFVNHSDPRCKKYW
ncbi:MAG: hypothetical protein ACRBCJ_10495 [Hyphomicrobiaceae bacterium]